MATKAKTFKEILTRSNKEISADRADRITKSANREYKRLIDAKEEEMEKIEDKIESMLDLSTSNKTTVDNSIKNFDAVGWVNELANLEVKKKMISLEISVVKDSVGKYFGNE